MTNRKKGSRKSTAKKAPAKRQIRTEVPTGQLARIIEKSREYSRNLVIPVYPDLDAEQGSAPDSGLVTFPQLDIKPEGLLDTDDLIAGKRGKGKGGKGNKGGNKKPSASPQLVHQEVLASFNSGTPMLPVGKEGPLVFGELNFEFLNPSKAAYYRDAYREIVTRHHVIFCEEVDFAGLQALGKANSYGYFVSTANTRNQAVGFLLHPRLRVVSKEEWTEVGNVQGVPDLRPAFALELEDSTTGFKFWVVVVHQKSMRGGPVQTAPIRYQQNALLAKRIKDRKNVLMGGDWNEFLDKIPSTHPLLQVGAKLLFPGDNTSTQAMGGRLDGWFIHQLACKIGRYQVRAYFKNKKLGRSLTDHGLLSCRTFQLVACAPGSTDPDCQAGGPDLGSDNQGTDVVPATTE